MSLVVIAVLLVMGGDIRAIFQDADSGITDTAVVVPPPPPPPAFFDVDGLPDGTYSSGTLPVIGFTGLSVVGAPDFDCYTGESPMGFTRDMTDLVDDPTGITWSVADPGLGFGYY